MCCVERISLSTDRYELTMVDAALRSGAAHKRAVFEVFTRRLPPGRTYGVVVGTARVIEAIEAFRFSPADIAALDALSGNPFSMSPELRSWLADYRFSGTVTGYAEGEIFGPFSPILTVTGTFAECVVLETVVLSILNHDCAVAAGASRMVTAAAGRPLIEMGTRRTDPDAAVAAARAAIIAGFSRTSNLEAGRRFGIATAGTSAHAFTLAHDTEEAAFRAQIEAQGWATTLLVDTYDTDAGIRTAVRVAREFGAAGPGAIRIDSGDLVIEAKAARVLLDELGATSTKVVLSGDLDAESIAELVAADAPVDMLGVGTSVVTGDGYPTASLAFKLVEIEGSGGTMRSVAKKSVGKVSIGGHKVPWRHGRTDRLVVGSDDSPRFGSRPLSVMFIDNGVIVRVPTVEEAQEVLATALLELGDATLLSEVGPL
jgi:nicotinate phosphoribosyltransferase